MIERPDLSLVFPVYDEAENLPELIRTARQIGAWLAPDFEIVVVDDGSRDASADIVDGWATLDPRVRLVRHRRGATGTPRAAPSASDMIWAWL